MVYGAPALGWRQDSEVGPQLLLQSKTSSFICSEATGYVPVKDTSFIATEATSPALFKSMKAVWCYSNDVITFQVET